MHHGIVHHALFSAKESVNSLCKDDILKIRVPDGLFSSFSVTSFWDDFQGASESWPCENENSVQREVRDLLATLEAEFGHESAENTEIRAFSEIAVAFLWTKRA